MKGLFFLVVTQLQDNRFNVQTGVVKAKLNDTHLLLAFDGNKFGFQRVVSLAELGNLSFFETKAEQQLAVTELMARNEPQTAVELPPAAAAEVIQ